MFDTYSIPKDVERKIKGYLKKYYKLEEEAETPVWLNDRSGRITPVYGSITTSRTNGISRPTEEIAIANVDKLRKQNEAQRIVKAINKGLQKAKDTCKDTRIKQHIGEVLKNNLINGYSRDNLEIDKRTLAKYRKRAFYFIAVELGEVRDKGL